MPQPLKYIAMKEREYVNHAYFHLLVFNILRDVLLFYLCKSNVVVYVDFVSFFEVLGIHVDCA
jgi:hypothetical protein